MNPEAVRRLLSHLFELQRLANGLAEDSDTLLEGVFDEVVGELAKLDPTAVQPRYQRDRVDRLVERARDLLGDAFETWEKTQRDALARVGARQAKDATLYLRAALGAGNEGLLPATTGLGVNYFKRLVDAEPFVGGAPLGRWAAHQESRTVFRLETQVRLGVARGETLGQLVKRVRGPVLQTSRREAEAVVRTAVNAVSTHARFGIFEQNEDVLDGYTLVVTMDGRTSPVCIHYGLTPGKVYDLKTGPRPPFHFACRTVVAPHVAWKRLGLEPPPEGTRATATGQKPAGIDFDQWLREAPASYAVDLLGPTRARAFRNGTVSLRDLLRTDRGRIRLAKVDEIAA